MRKFHWPIVAVALLIAVAGCNSASQQPLPTVVLDSKTAPAVRATQPASATGGLVTASGVVVPAQQAKLAFTVAELVTTVNVAAGDSVKAGQALAQLDNAALQSQIKQAQAAATAGTTG